MHRSDWLILFLAAAPGEPLDPVRMQKGLFLLAMEASLDDEERYDFEPYSYGPMSRDLYGDVRRLTRERLLDAPPVAGATWRLLRLTATGSELAERLRDRAQRENPDELGRAAAIR